MGGARPHWGAAPHAFWAALVSVGAAQPSDHFLSQRRPSGAPECSLGRAPSHLPLKPKSDHSPWTLTQPVPTPASRGTVPLRCLIWAGIRPCPSLECQLPKDRRQFGSFSWLLSVLITAVDGVSPRLTDSVPER